MKPRYALIPLSMAALFAAPAHADYCREFTKSVYVGGKLQQAYGTSCMQPDGAWKIVQEPTIYNSAPQPVTYVQPVQYVPQPVYYSGYTQPYRSSLSVFNVSYRSGWNDHKHYRHRGKGWGHRNHHHW